MKITMYTFSKKVNSTAIPSGGIDYQVFLKDNCSVTSPVIELQGVSSDITKYNYAYIPDFKRYYRVTDWSAVKGIWIASLSVDALASFRGGILSSTTVQWVRRSGSLWENSIPDPALQKTDIIDVVENELATPWSESGVFVLAIAGGGPDPFNRSEPVNYYALSVDAMKNLSNTLYSENIFVESYFASINPLDYIVKAFWLPVSNVGGNFDTVRLGWLTLSGTGATNGLPAVTGKVINSVDVINAGSFEINLPNHPQLKPGLDFMNSSEFTKRRITIHPFGTIVLDQSKLFRASKLRGEITVEPKTGAACLELRTIDNNGVSKLYERYVSSVAVDIPMIAGATDAVTDVAKAGASTIASGVTSFLSRGLFGMAEAANSAIDMNLSLRRASNPEVNVTGAVGSRLGVSQQPVFQSFFTIVTTTDTEYGHLLCLETTLHDLEGFVQVRDFRTQAISGAYESELITIKSEFESGVFLE